MHSNESPLVSVTVITYNSAKYVIETLESAKAQTYQNIELIISDDHSTDNTVGDCRQWIENNKERFIRTELITVPENTGVSANCNRGIKAAQGEWVKFIAGDDILLPGCIEDNIKFVAGHPEAHIVFSQVKVYEHIFEEKNFKMTTPAEFPANLMHPELSAADQFELLLLSDRIHYTPSCFLNKKAIIKVGGYDESNRLVEDYPMWLKLTRSGIKLHYFHKPTVGYRIHQRAINNKGDIALFSPSEIYNYTVRKKYAHPHLPWLIVARETWTYHVSRIFEAFGWNKNTACLRWWYAICTIYLNPFVYLQAVRQRITIKD